MTEPTARLTLEQVRQNINRIDAEVADLRAMLQIIEAQTPVLPEPPVLPKRDTIVLEDTCAVKLTITDEYGNEEMTIGCFEEQTDEVLFFFKGQKIEVFLEEDEDGLYAYCFFTDVEFTHESSVYKMIVSHV